MLFSFFGSYQYVYSTVYGFNQKEVGLAFIGITIGFLLGAVVFGALEATLYAKAVARAPNNSPEPEHRLYAAMFGSVLLPAGLFVSVLRVPSGQLANKVDLVVCMGSS